MKLIGALNCSDQPSKSTYMTATVVLLESGEVWMATSRNFPGWAVTGPSIGAVVYDIPQSVKVFMKEQRQYDAYVEWDDPELALGIY